MEFRWIKQNQAAEAIVVFGGWAVGPEVFWHLDGPQDILFASGYSDLNAELPDLSGYDHVSLLAWSFGVAAYGHWQQGRSDPFQRKVAVNGSLKPVNRSAGIPPAVFRKTAESLSLESFQSFLTRVFGQPQPPSRWMWTRSGRSCWQWSAAAMHRKRGLTGSGSAPATRSFRPPIWRGPGRGRPSAKSTPRTRPSASSRPGRRCCNEGHDASSG